MNLTMKVVSDSVSDTLKLGRIVAKRLKKGDIICLYGKLGSGKTVLSKGIAWGLGLPIDKVISPTFVLIRQYPNARLPLYHFDLYRLGLFKEITALGYEEYFYGEGVSVIEWADRLGCLLPEEYLKIQLSITSDKRRCLSFSSFGKRYKELLEGINEDIRH